MKFSEIVDIANALLNGIAVTAISPTLKITPDMLETLPLELRKELHEATLILDTEEIDAVIVKIRVLEPEIADGLELLAKSYQFDQIIQLIEKDME